MKKRRGKRRIACLLFVLCSIEGAMGLAAEETKAKSENQEQGVPGADFADSLSLSSRHDPIHISSRTLEFLYEEKRIIYRTDVVAVQGDVTIKSDLLTVTYEDAPPSTAKEKKAASEQRENREKSESKENVTAKQRLKEIIAEGQVEIISGDRHATGKKAVFDEGKRVVTLSGDAVMREGGNQVSGERVTVYLDEKRSVVDGGGSSRRVEMVLMPEQGGDGRKGERKP